MTRPIRLLAALVALLVAASMTPATGEPAREISPMWTASGTGLVRTLEIGDVDADGHGDVVLGGRGVLALQPSSLVNGQPRWVNKWPDDPDLLSDDNSFA